jgi:hypothetical protein
MGKSMTLRDRLRALVTEFGAEVVRQQLAQLIADPGRIQVDRQLLLAARHGENVRRVALTNAREACLAIEKTAVTADFARGAYACAARLREMAIKPPG